VTVSATRRALVVLGVAVPPGEQTLKRLCEALADSPAGLQCDWKITPRGLLELLVRRFGKRYVLDLRDEPDACVLTAPTREVRFDELARRGRDALLAGFLDSLPERYRAYELVYYRDTDADEYLILDQETADRLERELGTELPSVLRAV
jgi:hypothetical protein